MPSFWPDVYQGKHTSLADFERLYDGVGDSNYGWYQSKLLIYDAAGPVALQKLWVVLQKIPGRFNGQTICEGIGKRGSPFNSKSVSELG